MSVQQLELAKRSTRTESRRSRRTYYIDDYEVGLDFNPDHPVFSPTLWGYATDTSSGGCGVIALEPAHRIRTGAICRLCFKAIGPIRARVVWKQEIDLSSTRLGLQFLTD